MGMASSTPSILHHAWAVLYLMSNNRAEIADQQCERVIVRRRGGEGGYNFFFKLEVFHKKSWPYIANGWRDNTNSWWRFLSQTVWQDCLTRLIFDQAGPGPHQLNYANFAHKLPSLVIDQFSFSATKLNNSLNSVMKNFSLLEVSLSITGWILII